MANTQVESFRGKTSIVLGVLQICTGIGAILFWAFAYHFEWRNNLLGYNSIYWKIAAGCWCGALFILFPGTLAILAGAQKTHTLIRWQFWVTLVFIFTFGLVYLGWSLAALINTAINPAYLCTGAFRDKNCRVNPGLATMYSFSVVMAVLQLTWMIICCILCSDVIFNKRNPRLDTSQLHDRSIHDTSSQHPGFGTGLMRPKLVTPGELQVSTVESRY